MPKQDLENLITRLHETFAPGQTSPRQTQLLAELHRHTHADGEPEPQDPSLRDVANQLLEELEIEHPQGAGILREIIETLGRLGL
jgi:hypothetical protein